MFGDGGPDQTIPPVTARVAALWWHIPPRCMSFKKKHLAIAKSR